MKKILLGFAIMALANSATAAEFAPECQSYFKEADVLLDVSLEAAKAQGVDPDAVKAQYEAAKNQLATLPDEQQTATCKQALNALEQVKKAQAEAAKKAKQ